MPGMTLPHLFNDFLNHEHTIEGAGGKYLGIKLSQNDS